MWRMCAGLDRQSIIMFMKISLLLCGSMLPLNLKEGLFIGAM